MDLQLSGKVAIVSGASKGIGLAVTHALLPRAPMSSRVRVSIAKTKAESANQK